MEIARVAVSGTMESSDIMITIEPGQGEIDIDLCSTVEKQFGAVIRQVIRKSLLDVGIVSAKVTAIDKGALDCTIDARVKTAAYRGSDGAKYNWMVNR